MEAQFTDRVLICSDCSGEFVFTAGEQLFFFDKEFKNDPKRCKPCKSRRSGLSAVANGAGPAAAGLSRTETRTECSECGVQTTVPFKPTQGRPVLCRQCFQIKSKAAAMQLPAATPAVDKPMTGPQTIFALTEASTNTYGAILSPDAAVLAATLMASAPANSSVATAADLASILKVGEPVTDQEPVINQEPTASPVGFVAARAGLAAGPELVSAGLLALSAEASEA